MKNYVVLFTNHTIGGLKYTDAFPTPAASAENALGKFRVCHGPDHEVLAVRQVPDSPPRTLNKAGLGVYVTAAIKKKNYPLQGWVISLNPLKIHCLDGSEHLCKGRVSDLIQVINPPPRPRHIILR